MDKDAMELPPGVKLVRTLRGHEGVVGRIAWSPDGKLLATPSDDKVCVWDAETGKRVGTANASGSAVAFSAKSNMLAINDAKKVAIYALADGRFHMVAYYDVDLV